MRLRSWLQSPLLRHSGIAGAVFWDVSKSFRPSSKPYTLTGADGQPYPSQVPGEWGGHRGLGLYGRLDCQSAINAIAKGGPYVKHRVFFATEPDAVAAGYRPCARCCPVEYAAWKPKQTSRPASRSSGRSSKRPVQ